MRRSSLLLAAALLLGAAGAVPLSAQTHGGSPAPSPYVDHQATAVRGLSA